MTLKDRFLKASVIEGVVDNSEVIAATNAMIAQEFAIEFADWFHANCYEHQVGYYTASELLETFKKQKGL